MVCERRCGLGRVTYLFNLEIGPQDAAVLSSLPRHLSILDIQIQGETLMAKYGPKAKSEVKKAVSKTKRGTRKSGKGGKAKSRKQAIAIGLSKARKKGAKVPRKKKS